MKPCLPIPSRDTGGGAQDLEGATMNTALTELVKNRRVRFDEVRTEGKLLASLLHGWQMLAPSEAPAFSGGYGPT